MKQSIRIAYCIPGLYASSGMERTLTLKANYFADKLGYEVYIIMTEEIDKKPFYELSDKIKTINFNINFDKMHHLPFIQRILRYFYNQHIYKKKLTKTLNDLQPDITISVLRREINFINDIDDGSIKVGEFHFSRDNYRDFKNIKTLPIIQKTVSYLWNKQLLGKLKQLGMFVVLTNEDRLKWTELTNVTNIPNALTFTPKRISDCSAKQVIAVGRYTYQKGFDMLIKAWKMVAEKHTDWTLQIYGDGDKKEYDCIVKSLHLEDSCILNSTTKEIDAKYAESSIFVLSSRYEGMPMVLGEAMICGVPPVSFACPSGPVDIINDGEDGFLVENENLEMLADRINFLIENENIRKQMGQQAQISVNKLKIENIAQQWDQLFNKLIIERSTNQ